MNKISIPNLLVKTFGLIPDAFSLGKMFLVYTAMVTFLYAVFGQWTHSCHLEENGWWCFTLGGNKYLLIGVWGLYFLIQLYLFVSFCYDAFQSAWKKEIFNAKEIFSFNRKKWRGIGVLAAYAVIFFAPMFLGLKIILKAPNPNWRIEAIYFLVLFALFWVPIWVLRLSSGISYFFDKEQKPPFKEIIKRSSGRNAAIVLTFCCLILLVNVVNLQISLYLSRIAEGSNSFILAVLTEMLSVFLKFIYIFMLLCFCRAQQIILQNIEQEESGNLPVEEAKEIVSEQPEKEDTENPSRRKNKKTSKKKTTPVKKETKKGKK